MCRDSLRREEGIDHSTIVASTTKYAILQLFENKQEQSGGEESGSDDEKRRKRS
jgi:hypothetical protein